MALIHQILATVGGWAVGLTLALGYPGLVFLMALESMVVPLPSELVLPFAGYLVATGQFNFWLAILTATLGSLLGSLISYVMGYYGGDKFVRHLGKYLFLDETDLTKTEHWFNSRGEATIFFARFVPVVRHLISIPAGIGKMNLKKFSFYTAIGAGLWNTFLLWLGFWLGENWQEVRQYSQYFSLGITLLLSLVIIILIARHFHLRKK